MNEEVESTEIGQGFPVLIFLKFLQKRIDEHRKVCYYIIKLRENKQNKTRRRTKQCIDIESQFIVKKH